MTWTRTPKAVLQPQQHHKRAITIDTNQTILSLSDVIGKMNFCLDES